MTLHDVAKRFGLRKHPDRAVDISCPRTPSNPSLAFLENAVAPIHAADPAGYRKFSTSIRSSTDESTREKRIVRPS